MANEIIPYLEMCQREGAPLQRGMNFELGRGYSVILMSLRPNAPYQDRLKDDGSTLIYEGHDTPRSAAAPKPKALDQPEFTSSGARTQNGRFFQAASQSKSERGRVHMVRVYEKIKEGIWSYNGMFQLVDAWRESDGRRSVFKFKLVAIDGEELSSKALHSLRTRRRIIPTSVKVEVWKRDRGRCVICGRTDELHFDHDLPFSRGGTSLKAENVQLLCARHNLSKGAKLL